MRLELPLWERYSKKMQGRLVKPLYMGYFSELRGMRLAKGHVQEGALQLSLYWLVDEGDGVITDVKYQVIGPTGLIAAAEAASELCLRKNYDQASRLSAELLGHHFAFPEECASFLNMAIEAIDAAVQHCLDIPYAVTYDTTPIEETLEEMSGGMPGWPDFPDEQKLHVIEEVIDKEIRPYIELDAGGIKVLGLRDGKEVRIAYEGSCTTCHSSTGSTLSAIQRILRSHVHPTLSVLPEL